MHNPTYSPNDLHAELDRQHAGHGACCAKCAAKKRARLRAVSGMPADTLGGTVQSCIAHCSAVHGETPARFECVQNCMKERSAGKRAKKPYPPPGQFPPPLEPGFTQARRRETGRRRLQVPRLSPPPPGSGPDTTPEMHGRSKASGLLARMLGGRKPPNITQAAMHRQITANVKTGQRGCGYACVYQNECMPCGLACNWHCGHSVACTDMCAKITGHTD